MSFNATLLVRLQAAGFLEAVGELVARATPEERRRERDHWVQVAGVLIGGEARHLATRLHTRMRELLRSPSLRVLPLPGVETVDGALATALLASGWELPHRTTVYRALTARRSPAGASGAQPLRALAGE